MLHGMAEQGARQKFSAKPRVAVFRGLRCCDDYRAAVCGVSELHHAGKRLLVIASLATFATVWVWIMILCRKSPSVAVCRQKKLRR